MPTDLLKITCEDLAIIQETPRTGGLNIFTSRYMWLPHACAIFVYAIALRIEGALWAKMENHFHWNSTAPLDEAEDGIVEIARVPRSVARSMRSHSRRRGGRR